MIKQRRALRTRFNEIGTFDVKVSTFVMDLADAGWIGVHVTFDIEDDGVIAPRGFPELVEDTEQPAFPMLAAGHLTGANMHLLHILFGPPIPLVMFDLLLQAKIASGRIEVGCDHVERDAALGKVIERGEAASEGIRCVCRPGPKSR